MHASGHWNWDDEATAFDRRAERHDRTHRRARERARRRARLWDELVRYLIVASLLLWIVRPIGILVAVCWGLSLWGRYSRLELASRMRERWTDRELERDRGRGRRGHRRRGRREASPDRPRNPAAEARELLERVGDDPDSRHNIELARRALADAEHVSRTAGPRLPEVYVADVLEETLESFRERMQDAGIGLSVELDSGGRIHADVQKLRAAFSKLLEAAIDGLAATRTHDPRVEVAMGENLARTQVWVRIRHNGTAPGSRVSEEIFFAKNGEEVA